MTLDARGIDREAFAVAVRRLPWEKLYKQLARFALYRCKQADLAEDLAQEAIRRLTDPETSTWNPAEQPDPERALMSLVNGLLQNERTSARARRTVGMTKTVRTGDEANEEVTRQRTFVDERAFSEEGVATTDLFERKLATLRASFAENAFALRVLDSMLDEKPLAAICTATRKTPDEVLAMRRMIQRRAAQIARELDGDVAAEPEEPGDARENEDDEEVVA